MGFELAEHWVELLAFVLLVIGFFLAAASGSAVISYFLAFFCGALGGRIWYTTKTDTRIAWSIILTGFLIGFVLGSYYGSQWIIILSYTGGFLIGYYLHKEGYIKSVNY